ncbi:MAG: PQQ-binding-like beta-propeller repeat protein [Planctomycetaceae bacterium]|nr:PQQ-binding-like beta-propeller repeat protein [Planctomycetaceae bacterium]
MVPAVLSGRVAPVRWLVPGLSVLFLLVLPSVVPPSLMTGATAQAQEAAKPADAEAADTKPAEAKAEDAKAEEAKPAAQPNPKKPANPLGNLFRKLFPPRKPAQPVLPGQNPDAAKPDDEAATASDERDYIDARAPHDSSRARLLRQVDELVENNKWDVAIGLLQRLLEQNEDHVIRTADHSLTTVWTEATRMLNRMPAEQQRQYQLQYGAAAEHLLKQANESGEVEALANVASRYLHTTAGQTAASQLAQKHLDRGEFGLAARWFEKLVETDAPLSRSPLWKLRYSAALQYAGQTEKASEILGQSPAGAAPGADQRKTRQDWLQSAIPQLADAGDQLDDWPMFFGTSSHRGRARAGMPLLLKRWNVPTTYSHPIRESVESLEADLQDVGRAPIPAWFPLMVDGKIIFRTFRGVQVLDAATGNPLWETRPGISPELILSGQPTTNPIHFNRAAFAVQQRYVSGNADHMPLTGFLYRNGSWGVLNSDGQRLYVLEDQAILSRYQAGYQFGGRAGQNDEWRRDWETNRIAAYDLQTGRPVWEAGGTAMNETFELKLAGTYFLGAPVADQDELFAIGEKDSRVSLHVLDALTGRVNWSWHLARTDTPIDMDFGRRWWTTQPAVDNGVVICPTTMGWIVAIDQTSHTLLWADRYTPPSKTSRNSSRQRTVVEARQLNDRWCPSPPIIRGNRVIYAPPESTSVYCWDLFSGKRLWEKPKGTLLYVAGVFDDRVVLVGKNHVEAISLETGRTAWNLSLQDAGGPPSGFGVAAGELYHLPLSSGQLWSIELKSGKIEARSWRPDGEAPLGNLGFYRGMLISLTPLNLTSFEQREALVAEIRQRKQANPADLQAAAAEAEIHLLHREYDEALAALRRVDRSTLQEGTTEASRYQTLLVRCLVEAIRSDYTARDAEYAELQQLSEHLPGQTSIERLAAKRFEARGDLAAAFRVYLDLAANPSTLGEMVQQEDSRISTEATFWLSGQLSSLWDRMERPSRNAMQPQIAQAVAAAGDDPRRQARTLQLFEFHPAAVPLAWQLANEADRAGNFAEAENWLRQMQNRDDANIAAEATLRLTQLLLKHELYESARVEQARLAAQYREAQLASGKTGAEAAGEIRIPINAALVAPVRAEDSVWGEYDLELEKTGNNYSSNVVQELTGDPASVPWFNQHRLLVFQNEQRLAIFGSRNEQLHWLTPLRSAPQNSQGNNLASEIVDHLLFVLHRDVLHCLSPVDKRILWKKVLDTPGGSNGFYRRPTRQNEPPMLQASQLNSRFSLSQQAAKSGMLAVVNRSYVCLYGRRKFSVYDALTGRLRWQRDGIGPETRVYGTSDVLFVVPGDNASRATAHRAVDGSPLPLENVSELVSQAIGSQGSSLITASPTRGTGLLGLTQTGIEIRRIRPLTGTVEWSQVIPGNSYCMLLGDQRLVSITDEGKLESINLIDGQVRYYEGVLPEDLKGRSGLHVVADASRLYLAINRPQKGNRFFYSDGIPVLRINGLMIAFDREQGRQLWKQEVQNQSLVLQQLGHTPFLVFATRNHVRRKRMSYWYLNLQAIDKQSGRKLLDIGTGTSSGFRSMHLNMAERWLQLESYNQRFRIHAVERKKAEPAVPDSKVSAR